MSVKGVTESPLFAQALVGDQRRVTIGAPIFTNDNRKNSQDVQALITGDTLTEPNVSEFEAFGVDGQEVFRTPTNRLAFRNRTRLNDRLIEELSFDAEDGSLVIIRVNKEEHRVFGFMRQSDYGVGPTGPRGDPGRDGKDAHEGRDGDPGEVGCPGDMGPTGEMGQPGKEGDPGVIGLIGPDGCEGPVGDRGRQGPQGRPGFEGSRGRPGLSCGEDREGAEGTSGTVFGNVGFGADKLSDISMALVAVTVADDPVPLPPEPQPAPPYTPPPPTSTPVVPPPPPPTVNPSISICQRLGSIASSCGATTDHWNTAYAMYQAPNGAWGLSILPRPQSNRANQVNSLIMCGSLAKDAAYTFELSTPNGVGASLFLNCGVVLQIDNGGGTVTKTMTLTERSSVRLRFINNADKIPSWCSLRILNPATGAVVYATGQNRMNFGFTGKNADLMFDPNWGGNSNPLSYIV